MARSDAQLRLGGKVRLIVTDAVWALYPGGPQDRRDRVVFNEMWISAGPVAGARLI